MPVVSGYIKHSELDGAKLHTTYRRTFATLAALQADVTTYLVEEQADGKRPARALVIDADGEGTPQEYLLERANPGAPSWVLFAADQAAIANAAAIAEEAAKINQMRNGPRLMPLASAEGDESWDLNPTTRARFTTVAAKTCSADLFEITDAAKTTAQFVVTDKSTRPVTVRIFFQAIIAGAYTELASQMSAGTGAQQTITLSFGAQVGPGLWLAEVTSGAAGGGAGTYIWSRCEIS